MKRTGLVVCCMLLAAVLANKNEMLMRVKTTDVTDHQTKVNADGTKISIYFAQHQDSDTGNTIYYKKIVDESKRGQQGYNPEVYFRYAPNEAWKLLPKGCPAPEIKPKEGLDKCEMGWKVGKAMATVATYLGMKKAIEDAEGGQTASTGNASVDQIRMERTRKAVEEVSTRVANNLQDCLKRSLTKSGFTVEKVCMHKGLVAESSSLINSLKTYASDPNFKCDYSALKEHGQCIPRGGNMSPQAPIQMTQQRRTLGQ